MRFSDQSLEIPRWWSVNVVGLRLLISAEGNRFVTVIVL